MDDVNRSPVQANIVDVKGRTVTDQVEFIFRNQRATSLSQRYAAPFQGQPVTLENVPAFPFGLSQVFINPNKYRYKSIFINVPAGRAGHIEETCFVEPDKVKPKFPPLTEIQNATKWAGLNRILQASGIFGQAEWDGLGLQERAGLLNLYAKMGVTQLPGGRPVFDLVERVQKFFPARVLSFVDGGLMGLVSAATTTFHVVNGVLHTFPAGWTLVPDGSFKTFDAAGNLQITFARNNEGTYLADIDIDDHQGLEHAADVLKHKITGKDTHPYDIHEILIYFQGLDPGYELL